MSSATEFTELHELIGGLRRYVTSLASGYADSAAMRRIVNDVERILNDVVRLDIDAGELDPSRAALAEPYTGEKIPVPDTQYDIEFWRDVDDEGVGGQHGQL